MKPKMTKSIPGVREAGFNLIELMIAVLVGVIMLTIAVPSYSNLLERNRIHTATTMLYVSLNAARSEALKRRSAVRVCPTADNASCRNDGDWSAGWLVYQDLNANNAPDSAELIRVVTRLHGGMDMQVASSMSGFVQFQPTGIAQGNSGNVGEFRICHENSTVPSKAVSISPTGRVDMTLRNQSDCLPVAET